MMMIQQRGQRQRTAGELESKQGECSTLEARGQERAHGCQELLIGKIDEDWGGPLVFITVKSWASLSGNTSVKRRQKAG